MTKTEHYGLPQWEPTDRVLRTDFNEDNLIEVKNLCRAGTEGHFAPALTVRKMMNHRIAKIDRAKCIGCGACISICPVHAIQMMSGWYCFVRADQCIGCGKCVELCHRKAPKLVSEQHS